MTLKPFLKWVGGKTQILPIVLNTFPEQITNYHEPFLGGGSVLLATLPRVSGSVFASDLNPHLIALYTMVRDHPEELIAELEVLKEDTTEDTYYDRRAAFNTMPTPALFMYLNKVCFRGVYREGPKGFNVPFGHMNSPGIFDADHVRSVSRAIQRVVFTCQGFDESLLTVKAGDFVYLDPPYAPVDEKSFVGYTSKGFPVEQHQQLFDQTRALPCPWVMSNADVPAVRVAFDGYNITPLTARRAINSKNPGSQAGEVLIFHR